MTATNIKPVTLRNLAWDTAADMYVPPDFDETKKRPAIVSTHPIGSRKEQTSGNVYGAALADEGFVVIAFDASFQGASGREPLYDRPEPVALALGKAVPFLRATL